MVNPVLFCMIPFSSYDSIWLSNLDDNRPGTSNLQFVAFENGVRDRKNIKSYGGYNLGEAQRDLDRNPSAQQIDVFSKFSDLVKDLTPQ